MSPDVAQISLEPYQEGMACVFAVMLGGFLSFMCIAVQGLFGDGNGHGTEMLNSSTGAVAV
jgi:hypothetical protein